MEVFNSQQVDIYTKPVVRVEAPPPNTFTADDIQVAPPPPPAADRTALGGGGTASYGLSDAGMGIREDINRTLRAAARGEPADYAFLNTQGATKPQPAAGDWKKSGLYGKGGFNKGSDKQRAIPDAKMDALEEALGPFKGRGRNTNPRNAAGPMGGQYLNEAYDKLAAGDLEGAKRCYKDAMKTRSPVMLDLNDDGKLGTTGVSTAKDRVDGQVGKTVQFDIDGDGAKDTIEWMKGDGDGMLVDDSDGGATKALQTDGEIDGKRLFGDEGGQFANGYEKLKRFDKDGDGKLTGAELDGLKVWVDNGDARLGQGELKTLRELGITEISVRMHVEQNERGEDLMRSSFTQDGKSKVTEDVWFADAKTSN